MSARAHRAERAALHLPSHPLSPPMWWSYCYALGSCLLPGAPLIASALLRTPIFSSLSWQLFLTLLQAFHLAQLLEAVYKNKKQTKVSDIRMKPLLLLLACSQTTTSNSPLYSPGTDYSFAICPQPSHRILCTFYSLCCFTITQWWHPSLSWAMSTFVQFYL